MGWTLQRGADDKSFDAWGFAVPRKSWGNQQVGEATFEAPGALADSEPVLAYDDQITIRKDGVIWFQGRIIETPAMGDGPKEGLAYKAVDAWFDLDETPFQQQWNGNYTTHLFININSARQLVSVRATVIAVVEYAAANGVAIQVGTVLPNNDEALWFPPPEEITDRTCGQVIRDQLRWIPQVVAWIDHSTTPPTFHCRRAKYLKALTLGPLPANEAQRTWLSSIQAFGIRKRSDLIRPAVVFYYERKGSVDGKEVQELAIDQYPANAIASGSSRRRGALVQTFTLMGRNITTVSAEIFTFPIETGSLNWWKGRFPVLAKPEVENLVIEEVNRGTNYPNMLERGQITPWMKLDNGAPVGFYEDLIQAVVSYDVFDTSDPNIGRIVNIVKERIALKVIATNAESGVYSAIASVEEADPIPQGLAQNIYEALATPQWEGQVFLTAEELQVRAGSDDPPTTPRIGVRLNLAGLKADWADMNALVQRIEEDAETGTMSVAFGPPTHLGAADLIELLFAGRRRRRWTNPATQENGELEGSGSSLELGEATALDNPLLGVSGKTKVFKVYDGLKQIKLDGINKVFEITDGTNKVTLDLASTEFGKAPAGEARALEVREVSICEKVNGVDNVAKVLGIFGKSYGHTPAT